MVEEAETTSIVTEFVYDLMPKIQAYELLASVQIPTDLFAGVTLSPHRHW